MEGLIYLVTNKINGKKYVGQSSRNWPIRKNEHIIAPRSYSVIDCAIQKYGKHNFKWIILEEGIKTQKRLNLLEKFYIIYHNSKTDKWGYNLREGGSNGKLHKSTKQKISEVKKNMSEETRRKMSESKIGKNHPMYGKQRGKYHGTCYSKKDRNPWTKVWATDISYQGHNTRLGNYNDPISGEIVFNFVFKELYGGLNYE